VKEQRVKEWKSGRVEEWKSGRVEEWKRWSCGGAGVESRERAEENPRIPA
jgi:hypothetical protein